MTAKERVLARYPRACVWTDPWDHDHQIVTFNDDDGGLDSLSDYKPTTHQAWADAARRLP